MILQYWRVIIPISSFVMEYAVKGNCYKCNLLITDSVSIPSVAEMFWKSNKPADDQL